MVNGAIECASDIDTSAFKNPELFHTEFRDRILEMVCVSMPCKIVSYNRATHLATVKPLVNFKYANGPTVEWKTIPDVEIRRIMAGGFVIDFPINEGDTGWLIAVDRDSLDAKERSNTALPRSSIVNSYKSGFWIPDQWGSDKKLGVCGITRDAQDVPVDESGRLVIENKNGSQKISIGSGDIKVYAGDMTTNVTNNKNVSVAVKTTVSSPTIDITASSETKLTSPSIKFIGDVEITGKLTVSDIITASGDLVDMNGTKFSTHKHPTAAQGSPSSPTPGT